MPRNLTFLLVMAIFLFSGLYTASPASANSTMQGFFVKVTYEDDTAAEKRLKSITIKNSQGNETTLPIDGNAKLTINSLPTTINAFKQGMEVEADVYLRRVKALRGQSGESQGEIDHREKIVTGTINRIDKNGKFLSILLDDGDSKTYYLNNETEIFKGTTLVDLSTIYEGDRVKLLFSEYDTNYIRSIDVIVQGVKIESLYKGTIHRIEPINNKLIVKNEQVFQNWMWQPNTDKSNSSYNFSRKVPIYVGNQQIKQDRLRYYVDHDVYYVTVSQFGEEVIEKMVVKRMNERTFYEPMHSVSILQKWIKLKETGSINYHDGTILIRNGRLVDSNSLQSSGSAFVVTDGVQKSQYANVVHITNDGFQSPNLANHTIYFGRISSTAPYELQLRNAKELSNNYWKDTNVSKLYFSNDTVAVKDSRNSVLRLIARDEMEDQIDQYGYFYVSNQTIVAAHLIGRSTPEANLVSVGRIDKIDQINPAIISIRNVSQWQKGVWIEAGKISSINIEQATIIRDGKVITVEELKGGERLYLLHESKVKGRILLVD
ncbi:hypothetical protein BGM26_19565 [Bacillus sp. FJAT-29790]|uniref:hypothetical protein n=1 Tax=Bacillus sp. FJAT-29790 TaxID=1895002 RepID=UPI001C2412E9|nr:hypothetical protein [Bacillus sp. FJAT-29790]MBU8881125.1 hypothetical protein [Bacillus sp. FJAT-29790]